METRLAIFRLSAGLACLGETASGHDAPFLVTLTASGPSLQAPARFSTAPRRPSGKPAPDP
ncbi:hypothetical protein NSPZN2_10236 [Nitrospira defluvii]|uniref:Uncharacterized protein n=1 Tax=Nitrospira defluvii TaxID=330214 RepID=A0ABN7KG00_9BACT|nr:hypothetical protein NSPZN2_10236 [Nitrospira defluvii]